MYVKTKLLSLEPTAQCNRSERNQKEKNKSNTNASCTISFLNLDCLQGETVLRNRSKKEKEIDLTPFLLLGKIYQYSPSNQNQFFKLL